MKIYFVTKNCFKMDELRDYLEYFDVRARLSVDLCFCVPDQDLYEILHPEIDVIVKQKALEAYKYLRRPCVVERGGLYMDALPGLPGGVGHLVWNAVGDRMCGFLHAEDSKGTVARSILGYCDGRQVRLYRGETSGQVAEHPRGGYRFQWDPIFIPEGSDQTYGEMGREQKRASSPVVKAWDAFLQAEFGDERDTLRAA
jgi:XTP/dITP diphosphohydrolase